uniref:Uncharacterized protein n=1 Tax=Eiseniibacteriota bacterium TaxID=2212470 RepID=A0A832I2K4_UNCEI
MPRGDRGNSDEREATVAGCLDMLEAEQRVAWTSREKGDGLGYDTESFLAAGQPIMVEVVITNHPSASRS